MCRHHHTYFLRNYHLFVVTLLFHTDSRIKDKNDGAIICFIYFLIIIITSIADFKMCWIFFLKFKRVGKSSSSTQKSQKCNVMLLCAIV